MNRSLLILACLSLLAILPICAQADFITVSGDVSGVWDVDSVIVTGEVRVPPGEMLTIMPGTSVLFQVYCKFIVDAAATLIAVGTEEDSIRFDVINPALNWHGIRFLYSSDASVIKYCHLTNGRASGFMLESCGGAIFCNHSNPTISNNTIIGNSAVHTDGNGGGVFLQFSRAVINENFIAFNSADGYGGAISSYFSTPTLICNLIIANCSLSGAIFCNASTGAIIASNIVCRNSSSGYGAGDGGGVSCINGSNGAIIGNEIFQNIGYIGGGINTNESSFIIMNNIIVNNHASSSGGGICLSGESLSSSCEYNLIAGNSAGLYGGGIIGGYLGAINNNTIVANQAGFGGGGIRSNYATMQNCILWGNMPDQVSGTWPIISHSDIQDTLWPGLGNISADPLFVNPEQNDFRLLWGSPCIDSGDPDPQYNDPDSTRSDMGAFYYDQSVPVRVLLTPYNSPIQLPPEGGNFDYMITASNCTNSALSADFWCDATVNDSLFGPLFGPLPATIPANENVNILRTQRVPGGGPRSINYNGYAVVGADTSRDSFAFWRLVSEGIRDWGLGISGWNNWGEWFNVGARRAVPVSGVGEVRLAPTEFALHPASPNPFNAATTIRFDLPVAGWVKLEIFDICGRSIPSGSGTTPTTELIDGWRAAGRHEFTLDASVWPSGVYLCRLQADGRTSLQKLILLK